MRKGKTTEAIYYPEGSLLALNTDSTPDTLAILFWPRMDRAASKADCERARS